MATKEAIPMVYVGTMPRHTPELNEAQWKSLFAGEHRIKVRVDGDEAKTYLLRNETRGKYRYWYAYIKRGGKLFKHCAGNHACLTVEQLQALWHDLEQQISLARSGGLVVKVKEPRKTKRKYQRYVPSGVVVDVERLYTRKEAVKLLGMTLAQFDYRCVILNIPHLRSMQTFINAHGYMQREPNLYRGVDVARIAQF